MLISPMTRPTGFFIIFGNIHLKHGSFFLSLPSMRHLRAKTAAGMPKPGPQN
jgi:hypothetical protein